MALHIYNSASLQKETFQPEDPTRVRIYNCGPTVYNFNHIGNFRSYIFVDLLRRYLKFRGYGIDHASNITDVDDKIIKNAMEKGKSIEEFTAPFIEAFHDDLKLLRIENVEHRPRATRTIGKMHEMVKKLEDNGHTYALDGNVYFRIDSFREYGKLSKLDASNLKTAAGGRFDVDEYDKEDVRDFALWKSPEKKDEPGWDSPWGYGRPGWHLECSAMIRDIYDQHGVDIHCGGIDLLFPHHENEIAQSKCAYPEDNFVRYWMHNEHLLVDGKKMSKSLGNYYTLRELTHMEDARKTVEQKRAPATLLPLIETDDIARDLRYLLLSTHYRTKLNFTFDNLHASHSACERLQSLVHRIMELAEQNPDEIVSLKTSAFTNDAPGETGDEFARKNNGAGKAMMDFLAAMDDDLNIAKAMGTVFDFVRDLNTSLEKKSLNKEDATDALLFFHKINELLDVIDFSPEDGQASLEDALGEDLATYVQDKIEQRTAARKTKDFAEADRIRDELLEKGIVLKDTPQGVVWEKK